MNWKKLSKAFIQAVGLAGGLLVIVSGLCYIFNEFGLTAVGVCLGLFLLFILTCICYDEEKKECDENGGI